MRKIYLAVFIIFIVSVLLFIASLIYLDREKHKIYHYIVNSDDHDIEAVKIDKYITDDKIIYRSQDSTPYLPLLTECKSKITLDRKYNLLSYSKEGSGAGLQETVYLENTNNNISFVATSRSEFACLTDLPIKQGTFIFEEESPVTYLPILENYDFNIGRAQAFNVITQFSTLLPPMKRLLILTSIRDEYLRIGSRKIKVECLLIKIKNSPQGMLWVTKSGRTLVGIEFPDKKIKITRSFLSKNLEAKKFVLKSGSYSEEDVTFNNKKVMLSGTLTIPKKEGLCPPVLLIGEGKGCDREEGGLFTAIADHLGKQGFLVLRFDKRGIGSSGQDSKSVTDTDEFEDASCALDYIFSRKETDPQRATIIGHGKGAFFATKLASETSHTPDITLREVPDAGEKRSAPERKNVMALILMAPLISLGGETDLNFDNLKEMAVKLGWGDQYLKLAMKSRMETIERVKKTKSNWMSLLRTRCFLKKLREELEERPTDMIRDVDIPVLILHGKEDEFIPAKAAATLDKALEESGNKSHKLIYYGYLGHFFGKYTEDGVNKAHYDVDKEVLYTIDKWLGNSLAPSPQSVSKVPTQ